jgi:hypothetical protein
MALACAAGPLRGQDLPLHKNTHSIMHFSPQWILGHHQRRAKLPIIRAPKDYQPTRRQGDTLGVDLSTNMNFASIGGPVNWDQGECGNCWVFGSTAASSVDDGVASGTPQLFSTQWFDSDYYATDSQSACDGGDDTTFAAWYNSHPKFIPWTNAGASYADGNGPDTPATPVASIAQSPSVGVGNISVAQIATDSVTQAEAIANIKYVLDSHQAVILSFFLPSAGWTDFDNAWDSQSETTPWAGVDTYNGSSMDSGGGGHLVCVVGYDDTNSTWVIQNSWGATGGRPDGWFELPQAMGYGDTINYSGNMDIWEFDTFVPTGWSNAATGAPTITTQPASQTVTLGATATFTVAAAGTAPLSYQWYQGGTALAGATSASYTTPATTSAYNGATFHVVVSNASGSATSANATLTVNNPAAAPAITMQPASQTVGVGATATFTVAATGSAPLSYQWYQGGAAISGATSASYTTPPATTAGSGTAYHVVVTNAAGSATSNAAILTVTSGVVTNLIVNGGFEAGSTGWNATSGVIGQWTGGAAPYAGTWSAWLCGPDTPAGSTSTLSQTVTIPASVTKATLAFYLHVNGTLNALGGGTLKVRVRNASGSVQTILARYGNALAGSGYKPHSLDLSACKGQTVTLTFAANPDDARQKTRSRTSFALDNVSLDCQ